MIYLGLLLLSAATLLLEINLTRLFSVSQFYHFAFMIVSLALLGFGASGSALTLFPRWGRARPATALVLACSGFAVSAVGGLLLVNLMPFDSYSVAWDRRQLGILLVHYLGLATPFFFSGVAVGLLLTTHSGRVSTIYLLNLFGSACGCALALVVPQYVSSERIVLICALLSFLAALLCTFAEKKGIRQSMIVLAMVLAGAAAFARYPGAFGLRMSPYKDLQRALDTPGAELVSTRWNAFSRVDLVNSRLIRSVPGLSYRFLGTIPQQLGVTVDGDDITGIPDPAADLGFAHYVPSALAYSLYPGAAALVVQPRGGLEITIARANDATAITAVEPNQLIVDAAKETYSQPGVRVTSATGRSYAAATTRRYDVVTLCLTGSYHPVQSGAYSLAEDYQYTVEALLAYIALLNSGGTFQATRWLQTPPSEEIRLFATAVEAAEVAGARPHQAILFFRGYNTATVLVKPAGFTDLELAEARGWLTSRAYDVVYAPKLGADEVNIHNRLAEPTYYDLAIGLLDPTRRREMYASYPFEIKPATDDRPFFGHFFRWSQISDLVRQLGHSWQPFGGAGYLTVLVLLVLAGASATAIIIAPLVFGRIGQTRTRSSRGYQSATVAYFGLIGLGFLYAEIPLAQQFVLFLGQPVYALTTVLFALLLFSGLGSSASRHLAHAPSLLALIVLLVLYPAFLPLIQSWFLGKDLMTRILISIAILSPLGFALGIQLPKGLHLLQISDPALVPWAWGINGAFSVVASVSAAMIALAFGFSAVLYLGAACYLCALLALRRMT